jgi:hypothetical protein
MTPSNEPDAGDDKSAKSSGDKFFVGVISTNWLGRRRRVTANAPKVLQFATRSGCLSSPPGAKRAPDLGKAARGSHQGEDITMTKKSINRLARAAGAAALIAALTGAVLAVAGADQAAAQAAKGPKELRNVRYCEVLTLKRQRLTFEISVYNTLGQNFCPPEQWAALGAKKLAKEFKVDFVKLNGPRYWTLDSIQAAGETASGATATFGGIAMTQRATIDLKLWQAKEGGYRVTAVKRDTVFNYKAGRPVYELISPEGDVYMMQSYSQIVDPRLSSDDLAGLSKRLKLPKGWTYQTRILPADYALKANGTAYVVQDDLYNSYQRRGK